MSNFSFGTVFGDGGVHRGEQQLVCPCGNRTDWVQMTSTPTETSALCKDCGATVVIRD